MHVMVGSIAFKTTRDMQGNRSARATAVEWVERVATKHDAPSRASKSKREMRDKAWGEGVGRAKGARMSTLMTSA